MFLSLPVAVDGNGVGDFVNLYLTDDETAKFHRCDLVIDRLQKVENSGFCG
ncbi:hypothetical protein ACJ41I_05845 [Bifidobacterium catenulatum]|uniref:hypothetical protein n=1 Tax=Bifidobacterium catenulatum TaxID=1686 RepID=UPI000A559ED0|nr:hypothetical protein [Bifidobacterium catenulatum]